MCASPAFSLAARRSSAFPRSSLTSAWRAARCSRHRSSASDQSSRAFSSACLRASLSLVRLLFSSVLLLLMPVSIRRSESSRAPVCLSSLRRRTESSLKRCSESVANLTSPSRFDTLDSSRRTCSAASRICASFSASSRAWSVHKRSPRSPRSRRASASRRMAAATPSEASRRDAKNSACALCLSASARALAALSAWRRSSWASSALSARRMVRSSETRAT
mmetsp:Transcript_18101/g.41371  ORF Transcript_18101/g.41371 Transcript_18101/m.41371 type:complete len:221 (+) Transcript_18101:1803-2465(+)